MRTQKIGQSLPSFGNLKDICRNEEIVKEWNLIDKHMNRQIDRLMDAWTGREAGRYRERQ